MKPVDGEFDPPDGGYGWIIVSCCIAISSCLMPLSQCFGIIFDAEFREMGVTSMEKSILLHLNYAIWYGLGVFSGPLLKVFNFQQVAMAGAAFVIVGVISSAFVTTYASLMFTVAIMLGCGYGIALPATYMAVYSYFKKHITLAMTFQITGTALAPIIMPQVCSYLMNEYGHRGTILILGGLALNAVPAIMLLRPLVPRMQTQHNRALDSSLAHDEKAHVSEQLMNPGPYKSTTVPKKTESKMQQVKDIFNFELFEDRTFILIVCGMGVSFAAELNIVLMLQFMLSELAEMDRQSVATAISIHGSADILGRLLMPLLAYRFSIEVKLVYCIALFGSSIGRTTFAFFYYDTYIVFVSCILLGLFKGLKAVFQSLILPRYIAFDKLASANGLSMVINGAISMIIGPILGLTRDMNSSYIVTLHIASFLSCSCIVIWTIDSCILKSRRRKSAINEKPQSELQPL